MKTMKMFMLMTLVAMLSACGEQKCNDSSALEKVMGVLENKCKGCYSNPNTIRKLDVNVKTGAIMCQLNVDAHISGYVGADSFKYVIEKTEDGEQLVTVYKK